MQAVHEFGHILGAFATGGRVTAVVLHPLSISRTDVQPNPHPLLVVWAGPILGVLIPLILWLAAVLIRLREAFVLRFFAGFCLIANGAYLALGSFNHVGDCGILLQNDAAMWHLWLFGLICIPSGLYLWNGQGTNFGLGAAKGRVDQRTALIAFAMLLTLLTVACLVGGR